MNGHKGQIEAHTAGSHTFPSTLSRVKIRALNQSDLKSATSSSTQFSTRHRVKSSHSLSSQPLSDSDSRISSVQSQGLKNCKESPLCCGAFRPSTSRGAPRAMPRIPSCSSGIVVSLSSRRMPYNLVRQSSCERSSTRRCAAPRSDPNCSQCTTFEQQGFSEQAQEDALDVVMRLWVGRRELECE